nr:hypothetical protein CFP56_03909 [Quercus suber]
MSKATISMCINTTGFGNSSTLSTQSLSSPSDYFAESAPDPSASLNIPSLSTSGRTPMPKFDMHLKELFSEEEIANQSIHQQDRRLSYARPLYQQQQPSTSRPLSHTRFATRVDSRTSSTMQYPRLSSPGSEHSTSGSADDAQLHFITDPTAHHQQQQQQQQQQAYTSAPAPTSSDTKFPFDDSLDFLDAFPAPSSTGRSDPASAWSTHAASELDLGFGTGGTAAAFETDEFMAWEANGGVDLFDGFFFGGGAAGAGNGNGHGHGGAFS